jgi:hypothetical protein
MYTYLMGAARQRLDLQQGKGAQMLQNMNTADRTLTAFQIDPGPVLPICVGRQGQIDQLVIPGGISDNEGVIKFGDFVFLELIVQSPVTNLIARQDNHSAGLFVDPMNHPQFTPAQLKKRQQVRYLGFETISEAGDTGRLVDGQQVGIVV